MLETTSIQGNVKVSPDSEEYIADVHRSLQQVATGHKTNTNRGPLLLRSAPTDVSSIVSVYGLFANGQPPNTGQHATSTRRTEPALPLADGEKEKNKKKATPYSPSLKSNHALL